MSRKRVEFLFLNVGHFLDHYFVLIFATVAALALINEWGLSYAELIPYATPGFVAFGLGALPAGWLADRWSRRGMMVVFFVGIGAASILTGFAGTPLQIGAGLLAIGAFAAIYHPVGIAMVVQGRQKTGMPLAINGIFGNMGVASAALLSGVFIDGMGWRAAFVVPGIASVAIGLAYLAFGAASRSAEATAAERKAAAAHTVTVDRGIVIRTMAFVLVVTTIGSLIFQSTTFALPKLFDDRLAGLAGSATEVGSWAFVVFAVAAFAQLPVGHLIDRYSIRGVFAVVAGLQAPLFLAIVWLTGAPALLVSMAFMLLVFGQIPINDALIARVTREGWRSRVYALKYIVSFTVSATAVPMIALLYDVGGFAQVFAVVTVLAAAMAAAVPMLPRAGAAAPSPRLAPAE